LVDSQTYLDANLLELQEEFKTCLDERKKDGNEFLVIRSTLDFLRSFLNWPDDCLYGADDARPIPENLKVPLPELGETLQPSFALRDPNPEDPANPWLILVHSYPVGEDLDAPFKQSESSWSASISRRFERLLRETRVPIGLLFNGESIRIVYAPRGENSGTMTFPVNAMVEVAGRPILGAMRMLLHSSRLLVGPRNARLPAILALSREYQANVSEQLAKQVLNSLYDLIRGLQAADGAAKGTLLKEVLARNPNDVYSGLLTVLLRLVFMLFAEDRGLMPGSDLYVRNYSAHGLFERLRSDKEKYPDTMDQRYGAWAQLSVLFRAIYFGSRHPLLSMPARKGFLFDPDRYPFLEGRVEDRLQLPLISDGVIYRVLESLLLLDGERLSYRTLDVEQIGSVYETMVGFKIEIAEGQTIALKPAKAKGAPVAINLEELLKTTAGERLKWIRERTDHKLTGEASDGVKSATSLDELLAALEKKIARSATLGTLPKGALVLQPSDERRKSGSHYTPRKLTEPIVRKTLEPILERLGEKPKPEQILGLKIADIAVGSGAFLVEASRQLGDELVKAWHVHKQVPFILPDEDEVLHARRLVAQRCLYGVDRNPMAVDLAKLSLWLATLARDHPFTFLDHSIRCGDSLVGLTRKQIAEFHWLPNSTRVLGQDEMEKRIERVSGFRREILEANELTSPVLKREKLDKADELLDHVRLVGDLVVAAFFAGEKDRGRLSIRNEYLAQYIEFFKTYDQSKNVQRVVDQLHSEPFPIKPFHWEIEFPEVFDRENGGFDAFVSNPPFAGRTTLSEGSRTGYLDWLKELHSGSHGNSDLVAHFFRRAFDLLRREGSFGLIATNTIGQGDTRNTGLRFIRANDGTIYDAIRRKAWPGQAAVIISIVHVHKGRIQGPSILDGRQVPIITAYLFHAGIDEDPARLRSNGELSFQGYIVVGMGFTFDDTDTTGVANPIAVMRKLILDNPANGERIAPYLGGEEFLNDPLQRHQRYVINLGEISESEARNEWPALMNILEQKVKPERLKALEQWSKDKQKRADLWWQFSRTAKDMREATRRLKRVLMHPFTSSNLAFGFVPATTIVAGPHNVFALDKVSAFSVLQSRIHETWARFFASTMKDDLRYTPSDCFETFPLPDNWETNQDLERTGDEYYEFRATLMVRNNEGLTKTYNRFHDPEETSSDILRLRVLHASMDRAVIDAYGWTELRPTCTFILDYQEDEDEEESGRRRKKPWRYRWPDEIRDEVLARLLALNKERAEEEKSAGEEAQGGKKAKTKSRTRRTAVDPSQTSLTLQTSIT
jgi:hypothetical protein